MKARNWSEADKNYLREHYANRSNSDLAYILNRTIRGIKGMAHILGLNKSDEFMATNAGRLKPGCEHWKLVKHRVLPTKTMFKPGNRPQNAVPVGTVVMATIGYLKIKIAEPNRWKFLHIKNWEEVHGPVPAGHLVAFKNGDRNHCEIENLELRSKALHGMNNRYRANGEKLNQAILLKTKLLRTIHERADK